MLKRRHRSIERYVAHVFEFAAAIASLLIAEAWITDSLGTALRSPLPTEIHNWYWTWAIAYLFGAPMVIFGILGRRWNFRAAGLMLMAAGYFSQFIAGLYGTVESRTFIYLMWAFACCVRIWMLEQIFVRGRRFEL